MSSLPYHLAELAIALDPTRPEHLMPALAPRHRRVLDVGCGAGQTLVGSGMAEPDGAREGWGVDVDVEALAAGRARWPRLPLVAARGEALPFADASFDLVVSRVALPYMRIPAALAEFARVLRPGGDVWLALHDWRMTRGELRDALRDALRRRTWKALAYRAYVALNGLAFQAAGRVYAFPDGRGRVESWQGTRGMRRALARAGFVDVVLSMQDGGRRALVATARRPG